MTSYEPGAAGFARVVAGWGAVESSSTIPSTSSGYRAAKDNVYKPPKE
jgi:hypothetical protein